MSTAKKRAFNNYSMSSQSRGKAYGALNILWKQMRPDLDGEEKDTIREERLIWIKRFLGLRKLDSTKDLSDGQIGRVLDEMKRMTGEPIQTPQKATKSLKPAKFGIVGVVENSPEGAEIIHLTTEEQLVTLKKLEDYIGWTTERRENYLQPRFKATNFRMLKVEQAHSLTIQMLNIAAHKDLKSSLGKDKKITRQMAAKYIPTLKKKLRIDQKGE